MARIMVSLPDGIINTKGGLGKSNSEVIRQIVISYLTEKGYLATPGAKEIDKLRKTVKAMSNMVKVMVELLTAKGVIAREEFDKERLLNEIKQGILDDRRMIAEFKRLKKVKRKKHPKTGVLA